MNKNAFRLIVALVVIFLVWVFIAGNRLPSDLKAQIQAGRKRLEDARHKVADQRASVAKAAAADPDLFRVRNFDQLWPVRFDEATAALNNAGRDADQLEKLRRKNDRSTKREVQDLLGRERDRTDAALRSADKVASEARKRTDLKRDIEPTVARLETAVKQVESGDYSAVTAKVKKAQQDWPAKRDDLQGRLDNLVAPQTHAAEWEQTLASLKAKPASDLSTTDYANVIAIQESVDAGSGAQQARALNDLSQQLYTSWDNVLVDLDKEHDRYRERVKHVATTVPAPGAKGSTISSEEWKDVPKSDWQMAENNIGMAIEHKALGKYDSEADHTPEPAEYAYMASPAEGRNQYGYWENRNGSSVWTWLPEYLILRDLLSNRHYQPIPSYDWGRYSEARRYGKTYYGNDGGAPKYGSHGTFTAQRYGSSRYVQSGGFSGSKYASGSANSPAGTSGYAGSRFGGSNAPSASSSAGKRFGSSSAGASSGKKFGSSSGMKFGSSSRSAGRSFGGRRR